MKRILIVEDDLVSRIAFTLTLKDNFQVDSESNPERIRELFRQHPYDVVLMDINLGVDHLDGVQIMQQLRQEFPEKRTVYVALTAYSMAGDKKRFLDSGFDEYLSKPIDFPSLNVFVNSLVS